MARIGKTVQFDGSRENISNAIVKGITDLTLTGINWSFIDNSNLNIYGEDVDLTALKIEVNNAGFSFTVLGDAPAEAVPDAETPPTADEITARAELKTAFDTVMQNERDSLWTAVETEYNIIKTTAELFKRFTDFKHLRQKG